MARLTKELLTAFTSEDEIDMLSVEKLPYLCAVTEESLRIFPPGVNTQPRITPPEGNVVLGEMIPGNVSDVLIIRVGNSNKIIHRPSSASHTEQRS